MNQVVSSEADDELLPEYDFSGGVRGKHYQSYREMRSTEKQSYKYHLSLSGEFFVAAELQRRRISATVTYGNAKSADLVVFSESSSNAVVVEVKSTSRNKWIVGGRVPVPSNRIWVFVYIPENSEDTPSFYVLTQHELSVLLEPADREFRERYREKHGKDFQGKGVVSLTLDQAKPYKNQWWKIIGQVFTVDGEEETAKREPQSQCTKVKEFDGVMSSSTLAGRGIEA